jgi:deoxyribose-phosphate aldolase
VCVYPDLVSTAVGALRGSTVGVASVATAFPSGRASLETKLHDVHDAVAAGATEIDMVIDRGAFLAGEYLQVFDEIVATRQACGGAHLKVILETAELATLDNVRRAFWPAATSSRHRPASSRCRLPRPYRWSCSRRCAISTTPRANGAE